MTDFPAIAIAPELTVVVPSYNERDNVPELAARLDRVLAGIAWEMIVVDDDSPDGTSRVVKDLARRDPRIRCIRRVGRRGLAGACIEGMLASSAPVVAVMDADLQHDETILPAMLDHIRAGKDLVVASRNIEGGSKTEGLSPIRRAISDLGRRLSAMILKAPLSDPMSGFFMIKRDLVEQVAPKLATAGFKILADIAASVSSRPSFAEVPYVFRERVHGESKLDAKVALDYLGFILNKLSGGLIPLRFIFFALVGSTGLVVHMVSLYLALGAGLQFEWAQTLATFVAMTSNFLINNEITYRDGRLKGSRFLVGLVLFYGVCSLGAFANVGVASWLYAEAAEWWLAGIAGALMGAVFNYAASSAIVWRR
ncbi:glycosyltransferase [Phreatobacter stygius]|uniref:Glycosyltransferase family 2 protein n=1 Tax=Phreatobacter stygius TaxID=1940610 RepID=A0A4D7AV13_9HYPH|nr:glycosyltransferase family 2 protein [Phreatobacter stygius]QCI62843.1 glycosyltransferase family 2 protein [Phreatobacter stygius]